MTLLDSRAGTIGLISALANLSMWGGIMVARGRLGNFAALARLRFAPPEIFAQRRLQPMAPQILVAALFTALAPLICHLKNPSGIG
jgi:hypothetical protein